jgi:hypothetical protein
MDPRTDSAAIKAEQDARQRIVDDARAQFVDELAEIVANAIQSGVAPAEVRADIDGCLSVNVDFDGLVDGETEVNLGVCPGCGFNVDHDDHQCPGASEHQIRAAVAAVMMGIDDLWGQNDTDHLMIQSDGTFVSPQLFGGTFTGSVKRDDNVVVGADGRFFIVILDADPAEEIPKTVKVVVL